MKRKTPSFVVMMALLLVALSSAGLAQEEKMEVEGILVRGNRFITAEEIKGALDFRVGDLVTEEQIQEGGQKIMDLGYFQRVTPDYQEHERGIEVIYKVEENPVVREIEITGNEQYGGLNLFGLKIPFTSPILKTDRIINILKEHGVEKGKILNKNKLQEGLAAVLDEYQGKGYTLVRVGDVEVGEKLAIRLIESKIERVEITGVEGELEEIAREMIQIPLDKPVKVRHIQASLQRINNSIYFEGTGPADISISQGSAPDRLTMNWNLSERGLLQGPTAMEKIEFNGATVYSKEQLTQALGPLPEGEVSNLTLLETLEGVYELYHDNGYTLMDFGSSSIDDGVLTLEITEGVINEVIIQGNERTKDYVIRRKLLLKPGDIFNEDRLRDSYRNLQQLGYFQNIDIGFEEAGEGRINPVLTIQEKKNLGSFNGALSYAEGGLVGKLTLSWKNMFGTGQDLTLGYDRSLTGRSRANWHLDYNTLTFFPNYDYFKISLYQETESGEESRDGEAQEYTLNKGGIETKVGYPLGGNTQLTLSQRYEGFHKCFREMEECEAPGTTSSITAGLTNDDRNSADFPTEGGIRRIALEQAGAFTAGTRFTKVQATLVQHFPTLTNQNLAFRLHGGQGFSLPSQERFRMGGISTLRGIPAFRADKFFLVNAEYRAVLTEGAVGVAFADLGFDAQMELRRSFGLELRAQLPAVGAVRLVFSWPVIEGQIDWQPKIDFGFGSMF